VNLGASGEKEVMADTPKELLAEADRARSQARSRRRGAWFPLSVFGILAVASTPLYRLMKRETLANGISVLTYGSRWVSLYWLISIPLGYAACVLYYRRRAARSGVAGSVWPYVATGLGLFAVMSIVPPGIVVGWTPGFARSWTALPLITMAAGLLVLSRLERDWALTLVSLGVLVAAALCDSLYDPLIGWQELSADGFSAIIAGILLLAAGATLWTRERAS
jgi:hypothetical protein